MPTPSDDQLTHDGLAPVHAAGSVLVIACGALAREILTLKRLNGWDHLDLTCLPAIYHLYPEKIIDGVRDVVAAQGDSYDQMFVAYADCGTGGQLQSACDALGVQMIKGPHCYSFFDGNQEFARHSESEIDAFYLTDFLARQFDAFVWKPMGLDRHPDLRDMIFGNYRKLVFLAQTDDAALTLKAEDCANRLGLSFERRLTGYGDLETSLAKVSAGKV